MAATNTDSTSRYASTVGYAESVARTTLDKAWKVLIDYQAWNPTFVGAEVVPVKGEHRSEGELVLIRKPLTDVKGDPLPEFYAETVKVVPRQHIVWCVYPKEGDAFRNFVDFGLTEVSDGVKFNVYYYMQNHLTGDLLAKQRQQLGTSLQTLTTAFKNYCEAKA